MSRSRSNPTKRWTEREALRSKGQFWTPEWVARAMVRYVLASSSEVFDPSVGAGAFLLAAKAIGKETRRRIRLRGAELHPEVLAGARARGLSTRDLDNVLAGDFLRLRPDPLPSGIVANPPYIRHHRLDPATKRFLKVAAREVLGFPLDGRAGYHVYFLIHALQLLPEQGRLAFLVPADTCEGVFASRLWSWIAERFRIDAAVTFDAPATPFPGVDTNPVVLLISRQAPLPNLMWGRCALPGSPAFERWVSAGLHPTTSAALGALVRPVREALATGLTRPPALAQEGGPVLGDFARVMRGIATGANDYFHLTRERAEKLGIPGEFLKPAVGRTRDVAGSRLTRKDLSSLEDAGRATLLFSPDGRALSAFPAPVRRYLQAGERQGLPARALISQRRPWYRMEQRDPPPFLFAYLGRRNARFIRNDARARPLTGFLCIYPRDSADPGWADRMWRILSDPRTVDALSRVGKSYGGGAIKVEPRSLERLPLRPELVEAAGLTLNIRAHDRTTGTALPVTELRRSSDVRG